MIDLDHNYDELFFKKNNLELIRNEEDEIFDAAKELEGWSNKTLIRDDKAIFLNETLNLIYESKSIVGKTYGGRLADSFILKYEDLINETSEYLSMEKAIGWFQGRMEFGPRALGARSILGDPRSDKMQKNLNLKVKYK